MIDIKELPEEPPIKERKQRFMREVKGHYTEKEFLDILAQTRISSMRVIKALKAFMVDGKSYNDIPGISKQHIYNAIYRLKKRGLI